VHGCHAGASDGDAIADVNLELGHIARVDRQSSAPFDGGPLDVDYAANALDNPAKHQ
jgi:hypothetical protein